MISSALAGGDTYAFSLLEWCKPPRSTIISHSQETKTSRHLHAYTHSLLWVFMLKGGKRGTRGSPRMYVVPQEVIQILKIECIATDLVEFELVICLPLDNARASSQCLRKRDVNAPLAAARLDPTYSDAFRHTV